MLLISSTCVLAFAGLSVLNAEAQTYSFTTFAGLAGSSGTNDGVGSTARFYYPKGVAVDGDGNVYVADGVNSTIRKITPAGAVSTLAGQAGSVGSVDGTGSAARFYDPHGVAVDGDGNVYVADTVNQTVRKVSPAGEVSTLAGLARNIGSADGIGSDARFYEPSGVAVDGDGNVYVADSINCTIRKITPAGAVSTLAGLAGSYGSADGTGSAARFDDPQGVTVDGAGNVYVADTYNHTIRKVTPAGVVTTLAGVAGTLGFQDGTGSAALFFQPFGVGAYADGNICVADTYLGTIRKVVHQVTTPCGTMSAPVGAVSTLAGWPGYYGGSADGAGSAARFNWPSSVAVDGAGNVYVADTDNHTIRKGVPLGSAIIPGDIFPNRWTNPASDHWEHPGSWSLCLAPSSNQGAVLITNANTKTVLIDGGTATNASTLTINNLTISAMGGETNTLQLSMGSPSATLNVLNSLSVGSGGAVTVSNSALTAGGIANDYFTIDGNVVVVANGTVQGRTVYLGSQTGSYGVVSVTDGSMACGDHLLVGGNGAGAVWESGGQWVATNILSAIGFVGPGQVAISNSVALAGDLAVGCYTQGVSTAANALTVVGGQLVANGEYTMIGCSGVGQLTVAGATVNLKSLLGVGIDKGTGAVWIVGGQLAVTNDDTFIGCSGLGELIVSNGIVQVNTVYVGDDPFAISDLFYTNAPVSQNVSGGISDGTLTAAGGLMMVHSNLVIGAYVGATGTVWATGGQIIATNEATAVGYMGIGRMTVSNGTVETLGMFVGQLGDSQGTLTVAGGALISWGDVVVGDCTTNATGQVTVNGGDMFVINVSHNAVLEVRNGTLTVNSGLLFVDTLVATNPCALVVRNGGSLMYDHLVLDPNGDNDGDGLPNGWEQSYGLDPFNAADASVDTDGDGFSNLQEYQAGTDPTNSASALRIIELEPDDDDVLVTWTAVGGKRYVLQTTTGDSGSFSNNFVDLNPAIVASGTGETTVTVLHLGAATNAPSRFYRVRLLPSP